jgi:hypothetical protein
MGPCAAEAGNMQSVPSVAAIIAPANNTATMREKEIMFP